MKNKILLFLISAVVLFGAVQTFTKFQPETSVGENEYGSQIYNRIVSMETKNYKVNNFFGGFSDNKETNFTNVSRKGLFSVTVEANSICANDSKLDSEGCSGQKPFLMNKSFTDTMTDEQVYEVPFNRASQYTPDSKAFFAIDVDRDMKYYEAPTETTTSTHKSFFQKIKELFDNHFSYDTMSYGNNLTQDEQRSRDRYTANILAGIEKDKRLKMGISDKSTATPISTLTINSPVSLLDYDSLITTQTTGCNIGLVKLSSDSLTCKMINGFYMGEWMPFFDQTNTIDTKASTTMVDTETSLLSAVGALNGVNVFNDMKDDMQGNTSFFGEIFKPVTFMFDNMMRFFFGSDDKAKAVTFSDHYDLTKYPKQLTMTIPVTNDGTQVDGFTTFSLVGIDSVYGAEVQSCVITHKFDKTYTITTAQYPNPTDRPTLFVDKGPFVITDIFDNIIYDKLKDDFDKKIKIHFPFPPIPYLYLKTTRDELFSWCARREEYNDEGLIGRLQDNISNLFTWKDTKESQMDKFMEKEGFDVKSYTTKIHRGLILHLKKENLTTNNPANKVDIKFIKNIK